MDTEMVQEQPEIPYKKMKRVESSPNSSRPTKAKVEGENTFLYVESKRAKMEREKEEKRKRAAMEIEFSPQELALATVPGLSFDPRERKFAPDELRPQPIIRKRKKVLTYSLICTKVEIFLEQREVAFLSPSKIRENLNFSTEIQIFAIFAG